ncbi:MAG TPA: EF-hand domain-containing protein [Actinokineospora sp.]|nr:EF-hand domain-containing protein [Actinokineospora sp.]
MEISPFLERKLARRFQTFDFDGDGDIDRADFETAVIRLAEEFGHGPDSPARRRLMELSLGLWSHLAASADTDEDSAITVTEYQAAFAAGLLVTEESFDAGYRPFLEAVMAIADANGDGRLDVEEHIRWTGALMNFPEDDARMVHRNLDMDTDGLISTDDLLRAIHDFYFDEDPEGTGGWLMGALA